MEWFGIILETIPYHANEIRSDRGLVLCSYFSLFFETQP